MIREASQILGNNLQGCVIYASGHPCPMCLAAMYLSDVSSVVYAASNQVGEPFGLSTAAIYEQVALPLDQQRMPITYLAHKDMPTLYQDWRRMQNDKII